MKWTKLKSILHIQNHFHSNFQLFPFKFLIYKFCLRVMYTVPDQLPNFTEICIKLRMLQLLTRQVLFYGKQSLQKKVIFLFLLICLVKSQFSNVIQVYSVPPLRLHVLYLQKKNTSSFLTGEYTITNGVCLTQPLTIIQHDYVMSNLKSKTLQCKSSTCTNTAAYFHSNNVPWR